MHLETLGHIMHQKAQSSIRRTEVFFQWPWKMTHVVTATVGWSYLEDLIKLAILLNKEREKTQQSQGTAN